MKISVNISVKRNFDLKFVYLKPIVVNLVLFKTYSPHRCNKKSIVPYMMWRASLYDRLLLCRPRDVLTLNLPAVQTTVYCWIFLTPVDYKHIWISTILSQTFVKINHWTSLSIGLILAEIIVVSFLPCPVSILLRF